MFMIPYSLHHNLLEIFANQYIRTYIMEVFSLYKIYSLLQRLYFSWYRFLLVVSSSQL